MTNSLYLEKGTLTPEEFIALSKSVGWGVNRTYDMLAVERALKSSAITLVVRDKDARAVGCGRAFSDDLLMTFIPDIFVHPEFQKSGVGSMIVERMKEICGHTVLFFGAQPGNEPFFEKLGFQKSIQSYTGRFKENPYYKYFSVQK